MRGSGIAGDGISGIVCIIFPDVFLAKKDLVNRALGDWAAVIRSTVDCLVRDASSYS